MARQIRLAYDDLFKANEYAYKLAKNELTAKIKQLTGLAEGDRVLGAIVGTFLALRELADFEVPEVATRSRHTQDKPQDVQPVSSLEGKLRLGMSYTIVLNLPATTDIAVFNAIFKSLKENILNE
jgi:hypothetical protein